MGVTQREAFPEQNEQQGLLMAPCALPLQGAKGPLTPLSETVLPLSGMLGWQRLSRFLGSPGLLCLFFKGLLRPSGGLAWPAW